MVLKTFVNDPEVRFFPEPKYKIRPTGNFNPCGENRSNSSGLFDKSSRRLSGTLKSRKYSVSDFSDVVTKLWPSMVDLVAYFEFQTLLQK